MTAVKEDFIPLTDACVLAVAGPSERYLAMLEGAFKVLVEMPGGGLIVSGDTRARQKARAVIVAMSDMYDRGIETTETDVRRLIEQPASAPFGHSSLPRMYMGMRMWPGTKSAFTRTHSPGLKRWTKFAL